MNWLYNPLVRWVQRGLRARGIEVCRYPDVRSLLAECDLAIDAGANLGQTWAWFRSLGYGGKIVSFEPQRELFERLLRHEDAGWERQPHCLSDREGERRFFVRNDRAGSGLLARDGKDCSQTHQVQTRRLDSLIGGEARRIFLKTDCEGNDLAVVKGASSLLPRVKYILMEVAMQPRYREEPDLARVIGEMKELGFRARHILNRCDQWCDLLFEKI